MYLTKFRFVFILIGLFSFLACEKSIDWELQELDNPKLVVEAILTNENQVQEILLSQTFSDLNGETPHITDALVSVEANGVLYNFLSDLQQPGLYKSEIPFAVVADLEYTLHINWQGADYNAKSTLSTVTPIPPVSFLPVAGTDSLLLSNFVPPFSGNQQSMYQVDIDWAHISSDSLTHARLYFYTFSSIHISELLPPTKEVVQFPKGSIVFIKKFGLNEGFAEYLRSKAIETDWNGTFFYSTSDNLPTNLSNGALGFFSTCAVLTEVLIAE